MEKLQQLEKRVEDHDLFNLGYIIPQIYLLENHWLEHDFDGSEHDFFGDLEDLLEHSMNQDSLGKDDRNKVLFYLNSVR